jgi:hypothetical protein
MDYTWIWLNDTFQNLFTCHSWQAIFWLDTKNWNLRIQFPRKNKKGICIKIWNELGRDKNTIWYSSREPCRVSLYNKHKGRGNIRRRRWKMTKMYDKCSGFMFKCIYNANCFVTPDFSLIQCLISELILFRINILMVIYCKTLNMHTKSKQTNKNFNSNTTRIFPIEHRRTESVCYYAIESLFDVLYLDRWRNHYTCDVNTIKSDALTISTETN